MNKKLQRNKSGRDIIKSTSLLLHGEFDYRKEEARGVSDPEVWLKVSIVWMLS